MRRNFVVSKTLVYRDYEPEQAPVRILLTKFQSHGALVQGEEKVYGM